MKTERVVRRPRLRSIGFTLVELVAVVAINGLIAGIAALAFVSLRAPRESELLRELARARAEAIKTGHPVVSGSNHTPRTAYVLFLPDGRAIGPGVDPLTGATTDAQK